MATRYKTVKTTKYVTRNGKRVKVTTTKRVRVGTDVTKYNHKNTGPINNTKNGRYDAKGRATGSVRADLMKFAQGQKGNIEEGIQKVTVQGGAKALFDKNGFKGWEGITPPAPGSKVKYNPEVVVKEAKTYGLAYVRQKYGNSVTGKLASSLKGIKEFVKGKETGFNIKGQRNAGTSSFNAPPTAREGWMAQAGRMTDGGPSAPVKDTSFKRQHNFNLSNDSDLAQGSHHKWAQATSISNLISGQLRQAANSPVDLIEAWAQDKQGTTTIKNRNGSPFGHEVSFAPDDMMHALPYDDHDEPRTTDDYYGGHHDGDGHDHEEHDYDPFSPSTRLAMNNPLGAFGTSAVMNDYGNMQMEEEDTGGVAAGFFEGWHQYTGYWDANGQFINAAGDGQSAEAWADRYGGYYAALSDKDRREWMAKDPTGYKKAMTDAKKAEMDAINQFASKFPNSKNVMKDAGAIEAYNKSLKSSFAGYFNKYAPEGAKGAMLPDGTWKKDTGNAPFDPTKDEGYKPSPLPNYDMGQPQTPTDGSIFGETPSGVYNPWSRLEGGATNSYGPNPNTLAQGQMEAMALANAYFAPQRAELAYELGDMETDMRRLAANLGRQTDDPVLQAKLYKEASRAVRTLDIQQNTFAFQMAESRRSQDLSNWQFYDQLAAQEAQLKLANRQFYEKLELDKRYYNLQNWNAQQYAGNLSNLPQSGQAPQEEQDSYGNLLGTYRNR